MIGLSLSLGTTRAPSSPYGPNLWDDSNVDFIGSEMETISPGVFRLKTSGSYAHLSVAAILLDGKTYQISFDITSRTSGAAQFRSEAGTYSTVQTHTFTYTNNDGQTRDALFKRAGVTDLVMANISVREVL